MFLPIFINHQKKIACFFFAMFYMNLLFTVRVWAGAYTPDFSVKKVFKNNLSAKNLSFTGSSPVDNDLHINSDPDKQPAQKKNHSNFLHSDKVTEKNKDFGGGPTQPEMQAFHSVNSNNMVDLFSGDFSYNIPLLDVGGYPVNLAYRSGISMDQEASWTGLGWNVNPGSVTRNMRGIPDDFNGTDSIKKSYKHQAKQDYRRYIRWKY